MNRQSCNGRLLQWLVVLIVAATVLGTWHGPGLAAPAEFSHTELTALLVEHVDGGRVDYAGLTMERSRLDGYLKTLEATPREDFYALTDKDRLAFWINAYNAYTIDLVLRHYPVDSIRDIAPLWRRVLGGTFSLEFIPLGHLHPQAPVGDKLSLDDIEHGILRKQWSEPRVHFTLVCASKGCPWLNGEAFQATRLDEQLEEAVRRFIRDASKNAYDASSHTLRLSPIFQWFGSDFDTRGGVIAFVSRHLGEPAKAALGEHKAAPRLEFNDYDWSLND